MNPDISYWIKQDLSSPIYKDLLWSKPENKNQAGKLLIVGGSANSFKAINQAYLQANKSGIGSCTVYLPNSLEKTLFKLLDGGVYGPSTISGGFSRMALARFIELSDWSDGVLLAGELGRNSETAILIESFLVKYHGLLILANDSIELTLNKALELLDRPQTVLVANLSELQKFALNIKSATAFTSRMELLQVVNALHELTTNHEVTIVTYHEKSFIVSAKGQVSSTIVNLDREWTSIIAAKAAVWSLQNPDNLFGAITTSIAE